MSVRIQIENPQVFVKRGKSARTGKDYEIREQKCVVHGVGRFPLETRITVPDGVDGYEAGTYEITSPINVGRFGLELSRDLGLTLVKNPAAKAA